MDVERARFNMVEQQVRTWEVLDQQVLELMGKMPRERFVPEAYRSLAFADISVPLDGGQVMMPPRVEARLLQALQLQPDDRVLEIGTGSGFLAALMSRLARDVVSIEISAALHEVATRTLLDNGIHNVRTEHGDALHGWATEAPYDAIAVTGSMPELDPGLGRQLRPGGRMFVIVGDAPAMEARLLTRAGEDQWHTESLFETVIPPLVGARRPERFEL